MSDSCHSGQYCVLEVAVPLTFELLLGEGLAVGLQVPQEALQGP